MKIKKTPPIEIKLKSSFKKTEAYKKGKIYYNEVKEVEDEWFNSIAKYGINHKADIIRCLNYGSREVSYQATVGSDETKIIRVEEFDVRYIKKSYTTLRVF